MDYLHPNLKIWSLTITLFFLVVYTITVNIIFKYNPKADKYTSFGSCNYMDRDMGLTNKFDGVTWCTTQSLRFCYSFDSVIENGRQIYNPETDRSKFYMPPESANLPSY